MNTCDTCTHWGSTPARGGDAQCTHPKIGFITFGDHNDGAHLDMDEIHIQTGPKFGCIHHETAPPKPTISKLVTSAIHEAARAGHVPKHLYLGKQQSFALDKLIVENWLLSPTSGSPNLVNSFMGLEVHRVDEPLHLRCA